MGIRLPVFEAVVEVTLKGTEKYRTISWNGNSHASITPVGYGNMRSEAKPLSVRVADKVVKMFHIENVKTGKQAKQKASKYGRVLSVREVDQGEIVDKLAERVENMPLGFGLANPYKNAVAMDEFVWQRKDKRATRLQENQRDKKED